MFAWALPALLSVAVSHAGAALVDRGSYTTDLASGLDWLDLTETRTLSIAQVEAGPLVSAGWKVATYAQVFGLFHNNIGTDPVWIVGQGFAEAQILTRMLGVLTSNMNGEGAVDFMNPTQSENIGTGGYFVDGFTDRFGFSGYGEGGVAVFFAPGTGPSPPGNSAGWVAHERYTTRDASNSGLGVFLVRATVPVPSPSPLTLLASAALAAALARVRRC
jgi:hypothetical protein